MSTFQYLIHLEKIIQGQPEETVTYKENDEYKGHDAYEGHDEYKGHDVYENAETQWWKSFPEDDIDYIPPPEPVSNR